MEVVAVGGENGGWPVDYAGVAAEVKRGGGFQYPRVRGFQLVLDQDDGMRLGSPDLRDGCLLESGKVGDANALGNEKYRYRQEQRQ